MTIKLYSNLNNSMILSVNVGLEKLVVFYGQCSDRAVSEYLPVVIDSGELHLLFAKWKVSQNEQFMLGRCLVQQQRDLTSQHLADADSSVIPVSWPDCSRNGDMQQRGMEWLSSSYRLQLHFHEVSSAAFIPFPGPAGTQGKSRETGSRAGNTMQAAVEAYSLAAWEDASCLILLPVILMLYAVKVLPNISVTLPYFTIMVFPITRCHSLIGIVLCYFGKLLGCTSFTTTSSGFSSQCPDSSSGVPATCQLAAPLFSLPGCKWSPHPQHGFVRVLLMSCACVWYSTNT